MKNTVKHLKHYLDSFQNYSHKVVHSRKAKSAKEQALDQEVLDTDIAPDINTQLSQRNYYAHRQAVVLEFAALRSVI